MTLAVALAGAAVIVPCARAYYEFDPVTITCSMSTVKLAAGSTASVLVFVSPESEQQLQGCGMEQCPQTCGDGCLDENGWCTCAGLMMKTYTTEVSVSSSAVKVARASYSSGKLTVTGVSAGSATISVHAKLAKHKDATSVVHVQVAKAAAGAAAKKSNGTASAAKANKSSKASKGKGVSAASAGSKKNKVEKVAGNNGAAASEVGSSSATSKESVSEDSGIEGGGAEGDVVA